MAWRAFLSAWVIFLAYQTSRSGLMGKKVINRGPLAFVGEVTFGLAGGWATCL